MGEMMSDDRRETGLYYRSTRSSCKNDRKYIFNLHLNNLWLYDWEKEKWIMNSNWKTYSQKLKRESVIRYYSFHLDLKREILQMSQLVDQELLVED